MAKLADNLFLPEKELKERKREELSPSGKYKLVIQYFKTGEGTWNYSQGSVFVKNSDTPIAVVRRNYSSFPFSWVEGHKNGHDYMLCGEDYQGQTVIELDTGKRASYTPTAANQGVGFCWVVYHPSPDGLTIAVEGCFWACPYETVFYDFSEPLNLPYPELDRTDYEEFFGWVDNSTARIGGSVDFSLLHNKPLYQCTDKEKDEIDDAAEKAYDSKTDEPIGYDDLVPYKLMEVEWKRPSDIEIARKYIINTFEWRKEEGYPMVQDFKDMAEILIKRLDHKERYLLLADEKVADLVKWAYIKSD